MKSLLSSFGYDAATFASAEDFLQSDQVDNTTCLISDVNMPGLSGFDLQSRLTARGRQVPIIFVTASTAERTRARALTAGALGVLTKPFDADRLIEYIRLALAGRRLQTVESRARCDKIDATFTISQPALTPPAPKAPMDRK